MKQVKGQNTGPELLLRRSLYAAGVRGWRCNPKQIPGKPDIAFTRLKVAVFVDGAFWHGHPSKYWQGRSGPYWDAKIARNQTRDRRINEELTNLGWRVIRVWDFEINNALDQVVQRIKEALTGSVVLVLSARSDKSRMVAETPTEYET